MKISKQQKRADAWTRNLAWSKLTNEQKLASLNKRRGESKRQIARIAADMKGKKPLEDRVNAKLQKLSDALVASKIK